MVDAVDSSIGGMQSEEMADLPCSSEEKFCTYGTRWSIPTFIGKSTARITVVGKSVILRQ